MKFLYTALMLVTTGALFSCSKSGGENIAPPAPAFNYVKSTVDGIVVNNGSTTILSVNPTIKITFSAAVKEATLNSGIIFKQGNTTVACNMSLESDSTVIVIKPAAALKGLSSYTLSTTSTLSSEGGKKIGSPVILNFNTTTDDIDKFPRISEDELLTKVQQETFKYIWAFAHPVSGMVREGSKHDQQITTTGGTGFGIMGIVVGVERGFITRTEGLARMTTITKFLDEKATKYHGAFAHWINGTTGATMPFSPDDNGADLVETSFLMEGLLTARQYFDGNTAEEIALRDRINKLWNNVEWDWFRQNNQNVLYWHWSADKAWVKNLKIQGWNECFITYALAASSPTHTIPKEVYTQGWAQNGNIKKNSTYNGITVPFGNWNAPLFFAHYSFLGLNPTGLVDEYGVDYFEQNKKHTLANRQYCMDNPNGFLGYSADCWGLTASTGNAGYAAHSPSNDKGVIAPTAALSSYPFTPAESKKALEFFYYKIGDKAWKEYGFVDAFNLKETWFSPDFLAIDQAPIIVMIENHRTQKIWNLFMSAPEVKAGLKKLGFTSPHI